MPFSETIIWLHSKFAQRYRDIRMALNKTEDFILAVDKVRNVIRRYLCRSEHLTAGSAEASSTAAYLANNTNPTSRDKLRRTFHNP
jgi:hypothetical protein